MNMDTAAKHLENKTKHTNPEAKTAKIHKIKKHHLEGFLAGTSPPK